MTGRQVDGKLGGRLKVGVGMRGGAEQIGLGFGWLGGVEER